MTNEDARQIMRIQRRLYNLSTNAADTSLAADGEKVKLFCEKVAMATRELYFDASDMLAGNTWPCKERKRLHA